MPNTAVDLLLLVVCASILALKLLAGRRPLQANRADQGIGPELVRTTLSSWVTLGVVLGAVIVGARLHDDLTTSGPQGPADGRLLVLALVLAAGAVALWWLWIAQARKR
jgi:hypothetical protein